MRSVWAPWWVMLAFAVMLGLADLLALCCTSYGPAGTSHDVGK
jgi:hypothetical protein